MAELAFVCDHIGSSGHAVKTELFEPLTGLRNVSFRPAPDLELRLLGLDDPVDEIDGLLGSPELDVLLRQVPVLLLDRPDQGHDLGLEALGIGVGADRSGSHNRRP